MKRKDFSISNCLSSFLFSSNSWMMSQKILHTIRKRSKKKDGKHKKQKKHLYCLYYFHLNKNSSKFIIPHLMLQWNSWIIFYDVEKLQYHHRLMTSSFSLLLWLYMHRKKLIIIHWNCHSTVDSISFNNYLWF